MLKIRRKDAVAYFFFTSGKGNIFINNRSYTEYNICRENGFNIFKSNIFLKNIISKYDIFINLKGGGSEAKRYCLSTGLFTQFFFQIKIESSSIHFEKKHNWILHPDLRVKERRKYGLKKARRAAQSTKR